MVKKDRKYQILIESIKLLGQTYEKQKELLPDFVDVPFEVIDDFKESFRHLPEMIENHFFSYYAIAEILRINTMVDFNCIDARLKDLDPETFSNDDKWNQVRLKAKELIATLGESIDDIDKTMI